MAERSLLARLICRSPSAMETTRRSQEAQAARREAEQEAKRAKREGDPQPDHSAFWVRKGNAFKLPDGPKGLIVRAWRKARFGTVGAFTKAETTVASELHWARNECPHDLEVAAEERREAAKIAREAEDSDGDGEDYVFEHVSEEDLRKVGAIPQSCIPTGPLSTPDQRANELSPADLQVLERAFQPGGTLSDARVVPLAAHTVGAARELAFGVRTLEEDLPPGSGKNKRLKISAATALCRISQQEAIWRVNKVVMAKRYKPKEGGPMPTPRAAREYQATPEHESACALPTKRVIQTAFAVRPGVDAHVPFKAVLLIALGERELAYAYVNSPRRHPLAAWRWLQFSHVCHTAMCVRRSHFVVESAWRNWLRWRCQIGRRCTCGSAKKCFIDL